MKILVFNGAPESSPKSTAGLITNHIVERIKYLGAIPQVFNVKQSGVPLLDLNNENIPEAALEMNRIFCEADLHIWLTPLYHGGMTGLMKNCIDWLECSAKNKAPYLSGKLIGLICWAEGGQAMQGINAMDAVAKSLRAWTAPLSIPVKRSELFDDKGEIDVFYCDRINLLLNILVQGPNKIRDLA